MKLMARDVVLELVVFCRYFENIEYWWRTGEGVATTGSRDAAFCKPEGAAVDTCRFNIVSDHKVKSVLVEGPEGFTLLGLQVLSAELERMKRFAPTKTQGTPVHN